LPARKKQNFTVADGTHEMNMANVRCLFIIALLCVALNIFVLAVISCGTDHQLQSAMIANTVHQSEYNW